MKSAASGDADIKMKEEQIMELGNILAQNKQTEELRKVIDEDNQNDRTALQMIEQTRPFLLSLGKAKASKLVRDLVELCLEIEGQDGDVKVGFLKN